MALQSFSSPAFSKRIAATLVKACLALSLLALFGCATVRPQDKEFLADPAMTFGSDGVVQAHDEHVFSNREGSFGAGGVTGGGCGCN